ncbi:CxxxxCH/CxxCH domain-containing protein [Geobacter sp. DSM 9736]|uniref:CxxxxCH/CxxCH domain c-type cytochrome n=1 Tax=Geobacter sp. DSM 9736 TaxID=1277350 RepID=UPI000B5E1073|nr:CxxxxCH/CxxCH domain-containing protein [Geobacter sp. DSM 9736]SNB46070.1 Geobacter sulfurreducens CxxxxCH...CXXCH domain-containing protein [Geobacter sp. DSM 9736]
MINNVMTSRILLGGVLLMGSLLPVSSVAAPQYAMTCASCHDMPPLDSQIRDPHTGAFRGNHRTHQPAGAAISNCAVCHDAAGYTTGHLDGRISFRASVNESPAGGRYKVGGLEVAFRNQTALPIPGSCSNVNCHFESDTPLWGSSPFRYVDPNDNDCDKCHGAPPAGTAPGYAGGADGSHSRHETYYSGVTQCRKCHADHTSGARFAHATSAGRRPLIMQLRDPQNVPGGAYSGPVDDYLPSLNNQFGQCTATYCHSDGKSLPTYRTVTWGSGPLASDCTGCHGNAASRTLSGRHTAHTDNSGYLGTNFGCAECHAKTVAAEGSIKDRMLHVNKFVDYSGSRAGRSAACSSFYCHSDGKGRFTDPGTWSAGAPIDDCKGCHGARTVADGAAFTSVAGEPNYASVGVGGATSNSHFYHVGTSGASTCDTCHTLTTTTGTSIRIGSSSHLDGSIDVNFNPAKAGGAAQWGNNRTCTNVACHSGVPVQWGEARHCDMCHPTNKLKGAHAKHLSGTRPLFYGYTANRSFGDDITGRYEFGCSNCHPVANGNHGNGQVLLDFRPAVAGQGVSLLRSRNSAGITTAGVAGVAGGTTADSIPGSRVECLNLYCHSNGYLPDLAYASTPEWYGGAFTGDRCACCHGNSPNSVIPGSAAHAVHVVGIHPEDIYTGKGGRLEPGSSGNVSHGVSSQATTINCHTCHNATVTYPRNDRNTACAGCHSSYSETARINNRGRHVNGVVEVSFANIAIVSKAQLRPTSFASYTGQEWRRNGGNYKNGATAFDTSKKLLSTATWNAGNCANIACHFGIPVNWNDTGVSCLSCHKKL